MVAHNENTMVIHFSVWVHNNIKLQKTLVVLKIQESEMLKHSNERSQIGFLHSFCINILLN